jgi:hypothetical protein
MERHAGILGQRGPIAVEADEEGDARPNHFAPFLVPGGLPLSDCEEAEALADNLVEETFDSHSVTGFGHVQDNRASHPRLVKISTHSYQQAGQQQSRATSGSEQKLLVTQQTALIYFSEDPSE